jgi:hypothetical protein
VCLWIGGEPMSAGRPRFTSDGGKGLARVGHRSEGSVQLSGLSARSRCAAAHCCRRD